MADIEQPAVLSPVEAVAITDLDSLKEWSGTSTDTWNAVNYKLGAVRNVLVLSFIPPSAMHVAIRDARIATAAVGTEGEEDYQWG